MDFKRKMPIEVKLALEAQTAPRKKVSDYSSTTLIRPPLMTYLAKTQKPREKDLEDSLAALYGTALHAWLEQYVEPPHYSEVDTLVKVGKTLVSGQIDLVDIQGKVIKDYKLTKTWTVNKALEEGTKIEWEQQLNIYRWLLKNNTIDNALPEQTYDIERLEIIAFIKDYGRYAKDKGISQYEVISLPVWSYDRTEQFIRDKVNSHNAAKAGEYVECSPSEKWQSVDYKLIIDGKEGRKVYQNYQQMAEVIKAKGILNEDGTIDESRYDIRERKSPPLRCQSYCDYSHVCPFYTPVEDL